MIFGVFPHTNNLFAGNEDPNNYKVLTSSNKKLSISNVEAFLTEGDKLINTGEFEKAKETYDKARDLARKLAGFYMDLNSSFKGIDARIPIEMENKGRESIKIWAESSSRLASLYIRKKQPEVAVPLLVEIIRLMSPKSPEGNEAYKNLIQLGFVDTTFKGY
tara:strand:- start:920 stop:1405 length:486 start_codon:yes stop_codon:yes gene_type:complete